jgi:hypothetical protein
MCQFARLVDFLPAYCYMFFEVEEKSGFMLILTSGLSRGGASTE